MNVKKWLVVGLAMSVAMAVTAAPMRNVAGAGMGGNSPYATDAYPGFDGLDEIPRPERREKSWFLSVKRDTAAEQYKMAEELGNIEMFRKDFIITCRKKNFCCCSFWNFKMNLDFSIFQNFPSRNNLSCW